MSTNTQKASEPKITPREPYGTCFPFYVINLMKVLCSWGAVSISRVSGIEGERATREGARASQPAITAIRGRN